MSKQKTHNKHFAKTFIILDKYAVVPLRSLAGMRLSVYRKSS